MSRFRGVVGYSIFEETSKGVFKEEPVEKTYNGDILRMSSSWEKGEGLNDDLRLSNRVSIVGEPFAFQHFSEMKYVILGGAKWKITSVEVAYPRLILSIGGIYNG